MVFFQINIYFINFFINILIIYQDNNLNNSSACHFYHLLFSFIFIVPFNCKIFFKKRFIIFIYFLFIFFFFFIYFLFIFYLFFIYFLFISIQLLIFDFILWCQVHSGRISADKEANKFFFLFKTFSVFPTHPHICLFLFLRSPCCLSCLQTQCYYYYSGLNPGGFSGHFTWCLISRHEYHYWLSKNSIYIVIFIYSPLILSFFHHSIYSFVYQQNRQKLPPKQQKPPQIPTNPHKTTTNFHKTTTNHHKPLKTTTNPHKPHKPPQTSQNPTNLQKPPQTSQNPPKHYKPPQTSQNLPKHYKPPQTSTNHQKPPEEDKRLCESLLQRLPKLAPIASFETLSGSIDLQSDDFAGASIPKDPNLLHLCGNEVRTLCFCLFFSCFLLVFSRFFCFFIFFTFISVTYMYSDHDDVFCFSSFLFYVSFLCHFCVIFVSPHLCHVCHHFCVTTSVLPLLCHHFCVTTSVSPLLCHHFCVTISVSPLFFRVTSVFRNLIFLLIAFHFHSSSYAFAFEYLHLSHIMPPIFCSNQQ